MKTQLSVIGMGLVLVGLVNATPGNAPSHPKTVKSRQFALIDMAYVFKNDKEFEERRDELRRKISDSDAKAKDMAAELRALQSDLKDSENEKEKAEIRKQFNDKSAKYQAFRKSEQARFLNMEAKIYKEVYVRVQKAAADLAKKRGYLLIQRFHRESPADAKSAKDILKRMNRLVVYHDKSCDITDDVLREVNRRYRKMK